MPSEFWGMSPQEFWRGVKFRQPVKAIGHLPEDTFHSLRHMLTVPVPKDKRKKKD